VFFHIATESYLVQCQRNVSVFYIDMVRPRSQQDFLGDLGKVFRTSGQNGQSLPKEMNEWEVGTLNNLEILPIVHTL
jgi:hypothetical protein